MTEPSPVSSKREDILQAAIREARVVGYQKITRDGVARAAGCSTGLINQHFGTMADLRSYLLTRAVACGDLTLIAQGLAVNAPELADIPDSLVRQARASLAG